MILLTKREIENSIVVKPEVEKFDGNAAREIQLELERIVEKKPAIMIINFEKVDFITSYGISILLMLNKKMKSYNGSLRLASLQAMLESSLKSAKIDNLIDFYGTVNDAINPE